MNLKLNPLTVVLIVTSILLFSTNTNAQSSETEEATVETTSGCLPSSCRGSKTKFGEAKVISNLRNTLLALKSEMEQSKQPKFDARSYDIHAIVGESDDESLKIIVEEVKRIENDFSNKTAFETFAFSLPEHKATQIKYIENRLAALKKFL